MTGRLIDRMLSHLLLHWTSPDETQNKIERVISAARWWR